MKPRNTVMANRKKRGKGIKREVKSEHAVIGDRGSRPYVKWDSQLVKCLLHLKICLKLQVLLTEVPSFGC